MWRIARFLGDTLASRSIVSLVQTQMLGRLLGRLRTVDHDGVEGDLQELGIVRVGRTYRDSMWPSVRFDKETFLDARLRPIRRVLPDALVETPFLGMPRALPWQPSADCHSQSTPPSSWQ